MDTPWYSCSPSSSAASQATVLSAGGWVKKPERKGVVLGKDKYIIES